MPVIGENCEFFTTGDKIVFRTNAEDDKIEMRELNLTQEEASVLAWLINCGEELKVEIKKK